MSKESRKNFSIDQTNKSNLDSPKLKEHISNKILNKSKLKFNLSDSNDVSNLIKSTENKIKNDEELKEKLALDINKFKHKSINDENPKNSSNKNSVSDLPSNLSSKRNEIKSPKLRHKKKKKKKKKGKLSSKSIKSSGDDNLYLTEVNKKEEKKVEIEGLI